MRIVTVNVNGIRAAARKGFGAWLGETAPDVLLLQEVRAPENIARDLVGDGYRTWFNPSIIAGRAGVGVAVRQGIAVGEVRSGLPTGLMNGTWQRAEVEGDAEASGVTEADVELCVRTFSNEDPVDTGRWLEIDLPDVGDGGLTVVSAYLHSGAADKPEKMAAKYAHLDRVTMRLDELGREGITRHALVAGDFNIVHTELDITNWKSNHNKTSGVLDAEIAYLNRWFEELNFVDVQRSLMGDAQAEYTWWSNRGQAFDKNVGWRIDYQITDPELAACASSAAVHRAASYAQRWSDHAPLVIDYNV